MRLLLALLVGLAVTVGCRKAGEKTDPGTNDPKPGQAKGDPDPYTGANLPEGSSEERSGILIQPHANLPFHDQWFVVIGPSAESDAPNMNTRVFLRPDQQEKISDLWPGQSVTVRGRKVPESHWPSPFKEDILAAEVLSTGPAPAHTTQTADELLKEFRADPKKATEKYKDAWVKVTGVVAGSDGGGVVDSVAIKGDEAGDQPPTRIIVDTPGLNKPPTKDLKPGAKLTVRIKSPFSTTEKQVRS